MSFKSIITQQWSQPMNKKERQLLAEGQEDLRETYGEFTRDVLCDIDNKDCPVKARIKLHRSPASDSISSNVITCPYASPNRGGHDGTFCNRLGRWCEFSFDYPFVAEGDDPGMPSATPPNIHWQPPKQIRLLLIAMISLFGIKEKVRLWK